MKALVEYLHVAVFSPSKEPRINATGEGNFITLPYLTSKTIRKAYPDTVAIAIGHLNSNQKNLYSSKNKSSINNLNPGQETKSNNTFIAFFVVKDQGLHTPILQENSPLHHEKVRSM